MTVEQSSLEDRAREAAVARYEPLDSHMFVALSGLMPHEFLRAATDAAVGLVRRELESTYAALLEANAARDEARDLAYKLKSALELATVDADPVAAFDVQSAETAGDRAAAEDEYYGDDPF